MSTQNRLLFRFAIAALLLALPAALMAACGGGYDDGSAAAPADVPELGAAQLGRGAGPTPIPVTPTPTVTPSPRHLSLYDAVWKGKYTLHDFATQKETTKIITLEMMQPEMIGEGKDRRRDEGAMFVEGVTNWMALAFTKVDPETGSVSFRVRPIKTDFKGTLIGDEITGTVQEGVVNKGTFELRANREELPQRRPKAEHGGGL